MRKRANRSWVGAVVLAVVCVATAGLPALGAEAKDGTSGAVRIDAVEPSGFQAVVVLSNLSTEKATVEVQVTAMVLGMPVRSQQTVSVAPGSRLDVRFLYLAPVQGIIECGLTETPDPIN